jgi:hypothetical protein
VNILSGFSLTVNAAIFWLGMGQAEQRKKFQKKTQFIAVHRKKVKKGQKKG